jgi:oligosaccharide repeat unit polymerase
MLTTYHWGFPLRQWRTLSSWRRRSAEAVTWMPGVLICVGFGWPVLSLLVAGQRADIFRVLWATLLLMYVLNPHFRRGRVMAVALASLLLVPIAQEFKSAMLSGRGVSAQASNPVAGVLQSEFVSASQNLSLVAVNWADTRYRGQSLVDLRALLPPAKPPPSITGDFNAQFFREVYASGGGLGFTIIGEGYANFGVAGVVLWFLLIGLFVKYLHACCTKGFLSVVAYVVATPLLMIATRGDLSIIMSQFTKHVALPLLLIASAVIAALPNALSTPGGDRHRAASSRPDAWPLRPSILMSMPRP